MYVHYAYTPIGVKGDGKGSIILSDGTKEMVIDNIDTVIYCTGYLTNIEMLHPSLRPSMLRLYFSEYEIPMDWEMANNSLSKEFGDIPIGKYWILHMFGMVRVSLFHRRNQAIHDHILTDFLTKPYSPFSYICIVASSYQILTLCFSWDELIHR